MKIFSYLEEEQLLTAEACNIIKFNSIEAGYNTKLSVSLEKWYWFLEI